MCGSFYYAHGHPKEVCQLELTGARRTSRGKIFPYSIVCTGEKSIPYSITWKVLMDGRGQNTTAAVDW